MSLLWRYLLSHYLKVFALCVCSFIAILLTLRLGEIAYFATLGPQALSILWFALNQIPYVLPIAFPVSALISSVILVQALSQSRELTAFRSCGFSLKEIVTPIVIASLFLSVLNFYIASEVATTAHRNSGQLKNELRSVNPLLLLNNKLLMHMKGLYFDSYGPSRVGEYAEEVVFLAPSHQSDRLSLLVAKRIDISRELIKGDRVTLLTSRASGSDEARLLIENAKSSLTTIADFTQMLDKKMWKVNNDHLQLPQLLVRMNEAGKRLELLESGAVGKDEIKEARQEYNRTITEVLRRLSAGLSVFSLTLLGTSFGISISRNRSHLGIIAIGGFGALYLTCFFIARSFDHALVAAAALYLVPLALICAASIWTLRRVAHGIE